MKLSEALPREFLSGEYVDSPAMSLRDQEVLFEVWGDRGWPGRHRNITKMVVLASGHVIGWNENHTTGWSFPVRRGRISRDGDIVSVTFRDGSRLTSGQGSR